jgi:hypothetical protein
LGISIAKSAGCEWDIIAQVDEHFSDVVAAEEA